MLSTSEANGGLSRSIRYLVNHQSMEPNSDKHQSDKILSMTPEQYHQSVAAELDLPAAAVALMSTAANMNHVALAQCRFRELEIFAFVTAGVHGNAMRAGDPAHWYGCDTGNEPVVQAGTINTMVLINQPLLPGALAKAMMVMTEAKSAVLLELAIPSKASSHIASGTGTDQYIIAAAENPDLTPLVSASGHLKLGELIGSSVREATLEALRWQCGLERSDTQSVLQALGRFGLVEDQLFKFLSERLSVDNYQLLESNRHAVLREPRVVAAAYAYAAVLDRIQYGTLAVSLATDVLKDQAANIAVGVSGCTELWCEYWQQIEVDPKDPMVAFSTAILLGWESKWVS